MPASLMPLLLDHVGRRKFAFYPSILNADPNEWMLTGTTWSDVQVTNVRAGYSISLPRQYVGAVSEADDPILIVGLTKELEFREGMVWPRVKRVIEMPLAANDYSRPFSRRAERPAGPAPVVGIRLEKRDDSSTAKLLAAAGIGAVVLSILAVGVFSDWIATGRLAARTAAQTDLPFSSRDSYNSVVRRLGLPSAHRSASFPGGSRVELLSYSHLGRTVVLYGKRGDPAYYLGTMDQSWRILHVVNGEGREQALQILRTQPRF